MQTRWVDKKSQSHESARWEFLPQVMKNPNKSEIQYKLNLTDRDNTEEAEFGHQVLRNIPTMDLRGEGSGGENKGES